MEKLENRINGSLIFVDDSGKSPGRKWRGENDAAPNDFLAGLQSLFIISELTQDWPVSLV